MFTLGPYINIANDHELEVELPSPSSLLIISYFSNVHLNATRNCYVGNYFICHRPAQSYKLFVN